MRCILRIWFVWCPFVITGVYSYSSYFDPFSDLGSSGNTVKLNDSMPWFSEPLWGVTYYPFRRSSSCASVTEEDVVEDLRNISRLFRQIYVPEMFCNLSHVIVNETAILKNRLILGVTLRSKGEFESQFAELKRVLEGSQNISHLGGISVGYNDLHRYVDSDPNFVVEALKRVKNLVVNSSNPRVNVSTTSDTHSLLFNEAWTPYLDAYIALVNMEAERSYGVAYNRIRSTFSWIREHSARIDDRQKRIYIAGVGWPSAGRGLSSKSDHDLSNKTTQTSGDVIVGDAEEQANFIAFLICGAHHQTGIRYFYSYAFDPLWRYPNMSDERANWGLIDADRKALKSKLPLAMNPKCKPEDQADQEAAGANETRKQKRYLIVGSSVGASVIFILMLILIIFFWRRKREADRLRMQLSNRHCSTVSSNETGSSAPIFKHNKEEYIGMVDAAIYADLKSMVDPKHIILTDHLDFKEIIGEGHFGIVQRAKMTTSDGHQVDVAVKRLHDGAINVRQFILEGVRMEKLRHPNVLHLTGICFLNQMPMIVLPFMENDNLLTFVSDSKNELTIRRILDFSIQIADGMNYLHNLKLVHRDLAARNCMLDSSKTVKISDFGLCRDISETDSYQATRTFELPVRWMAPETILKLEWTNKSDVWSYGVVIWELMTRGKQPYKDILLIELRMFLENGGRLTKPKSCPDIIYDFMKTCWHRNPDDRPEFSVLRHTMSSLIQAVDDGYVDNAAAYYNAVTIIDSENASPLASSAS